MMCYIHRRQWMVMTVKHTMPIYNNIIRNILLYYLLSSNKRKNRLYVELLIDIILFFQYCKAFYVLFVICYCIFIKRNSIFCVCVYCNVFLHTAEHLLFLGSQGCHPPNRVCKGGTLINSSIHSSSLFLYQQRHAYLQK